MVKEIIGGSIKAVLDNTGFRLLIGRTEDKLVEGSTSRKSVLFNKTGSSTVTNIFTIQTTVDFDNNLDSVPNIVLGLESNSSDVFNQQLQTLITFVKLSVSEVSEEGFTVIICVFIEGPDDQANEQFFNQLLQSGLAVNYIGYYDDDETSEDESDSDDD